MTDTRLKNCPFCGGEAEAVTLAYKYVRCDKCHFGIARLTIDEAIAAWNRRAAPAVPEGWVLVPSVATQGIAAAITRTATIRYGFDYYVANPEEVWHAAVEASPLPPDGNGWRTDLENAPRDGTPIDVWACGQRVTDVRWGKPTYGKGYTWIYHSHNDSDGPVDEAITNITHWRPVPAPPERTNAA